MPKQDEPNKVIYSMLGVGRVHGTEHVLKDIYLGYFYGNEMKKRLERRGEVQDRLDALDAPDLAIDPVRAPMVLSSLHGHTAHKDGWIWIER
jgi:hypothetical protein